MIKTIEKAVSQLESFLQKLTVNYEWTMGRDRLSDLQLRLIIIAIFLLFIFTALLKASFSISYKFAFALSILIIFLFFLVVGYFYIRKNYGHTVKPKGAVGENIYVSFKFAFAQTIHLSVFIVLAIIAFIVIGASAP